MFKKILSACAVVTLLIGATFAVATPARQAESCICCGATCDCATCVCDESGCACDAGGQCECSGNSCQSACCVH